MFTAVFKHEDWLMEINSETNAVGVAKDGHTRTYDMPHQICMVGQNKNFPNYVRIDFEYTDEYLVFKFEENNFLVGDIYKTIEVNVLGTEVEEDVHVREFAMFVFGEDS
jgi:hypothetical protein